MTVNELGPPWTATTVQDGKPKLRILVKLLWVKNHK
jgi:hypothetical protein